MTRRNLELVEPLRSGEKKGTLIDVLDASVTAMGGRLLRRWILEPLVVEHDIWARQDAVADFVERLAAREQLRGALSRVADLERLAGKIGTGRVGPRDLAGLRRSLDALPAVHDAVAGAEAKKIRELAEGLDCLEDILALLDEALADDPPAVLHDGDVIRPGWSEELDALRSTRDGARDFIARLEAHERERTGVTSLKVGFNKVFGYYIEVTKANLDKVPSDYMRRQTLANAERYFTPELKEWEEKIFGAEDRINWLETKLFTAVRERVAGAIGRLQNTAACVATLDVLAAFADIAVRNSVCAARGPYRLRAPSPGIAASGRRNDDASRGVHSE